MHASARMHARARTRRGAACMRVTCIAATKPLTQRHQVQGYLLCFLVYDTIPVGAI